MHERESTHRSKTMLDAALRYLARGARPVPMHRVVDGACTCGRNDCGGKHPAIPAWKEFTERAPTEEEIRDWFADGSRNLALVTGAGFAVIDFDAPDLFERVRSSGALADATVVKSPRGFHVYVSEEKPSRSGPVAPGVAVDIKAEGGLILAPPSVRGAQSYQSLHKGRRLPVENARDWALSVLASVGAIVSTGAGRSAPLKAAGWIAEALAELGEGNRNDTFTSVAGRLRRGGLTEPEMLALLEPHAERVAFPVAELRSILKSVARYDPHPRSPSPPAAEGDEPRVWTLKELLDAGPSVIEWLVEGIVPEKAIVCVAAPGGVGKTWLVSLMALAVATGARWLDRYATKQSTVLHIDVESAERLLRRRYKSIVNGLGLGDVTGLPLRIVIEQSFSLSTAEGVEVLRNLLRDHEPALVILDPLVRFHQAEENSATEMARVNAVLRECVRDFGVSFLVTDHVRKSRDASFDGGLRGSSEKHASLDSLFAVQPQRPGARLVIEHVKSRWDTPIAPFEVELRDLEPDAIVAEWFPRTEEDGAEERNDRVLMEEVERLAAADGWTRRTAIIEAAKEKKLSARAVDETLKRLTEAGRLVREDRAGPAGGKAAHFRVVPPEEHVMPASTSESLSSPMGAAAEATTAAGSGRHGESLPSSPSLGGTTTAIKPASGGRPAADQLSLLPARPKSGSLSSPTDDETTTTTKTHGRSGAAKVSVAPSRPADDVPGEESSSPAQAHREATTSVPATDDDWEARLTEELMRRRGPMTNGAP